MELTTHQNEKLDEALEILQHSDRLVIKGSAGVGKTFMVNTLIKKLMLTLPTYKRIYCAAPTNKAVFVLKGKVDKHDRIDFITVHSALKLKRDINYKTGVVTFKPWFSDKAPPLKGVSLLIVDEASMLNHKLIEYIEEFATKFGVKVVFIGDEKQLNPIGEDNSKVFYMEYPEVELTEIIRQGEGNPIIKLSRNLDDIQFKQDDVLEANIGYLHTQNNAKIIKELAEVNGTDDLKYLAWTNKDVDTMNYLVRQAIYGTPSKIEVGESLIFNSPYKEEYFTNEEIKVETLGVTNYTFKYIVKNVKATKAFEVAEIDLKIYFINGKQEEDAPPSGILALHEDSEGKFGWICKSLAIAAKNREIEWVDYFSFKERFADLTYNHAITVHKSQGSTYKQAIVNIGNLNLNRNTKEKARLKYTAITRASDLLILYNS